MNNKIFPWRTKSFRNSMNFLKKWIENEKNKRSRIYLTPYLWIKSLTSQYFARITFVTSIKNWCLAYCFNDPHTMLRFCCIEFFKNKKKSMSRNSNDWMNVLKNCYNYREFNEFFRFVHIFNKRWWWLQLNVVRD